MRTIRNVTFVVLCAMVYLMPAAPQAAGSSCSTQTWSHPGGGCYTTQYYAGNCGSCMDGYDHAANVCGGSGLILVEFFCDPGTGSFPFGCCDPILD